MLVHPFTHNFRKIAGVFMAGVIAVTLWILLNVYGNVDAVTALADSIVYVGCLTGVSYFYWYIIRYLNEFLTQSIVALLVQLICLGVAFMFLSVFEMESPEMFISNIPLRMVVGLFSWIIVLQWYHGMESKMAVSEDIQKDDEKAMEPLNSAEEPASGELDRITVKDGAKIDIVKVEELVYIQAYGDYVMLYTDSGKFIKELTMKHLDSSLPQYFVRIHRSYIINTNFITRVELFGKETYQVRLKNGVSLRASNNGYKLLKAKLRL